MDLDQAQLKRLRERVGESKAYFDAWAGDVEAAMYAAQHSHAANLAVDKENVEALRAQQTEAVKRGKMLSKAAAQQQAEVEQVKQEIAAIAASESALATSRTDIEAELAALRQEKAALQQAVESLSGATAQRHEQMESALKFYKERLGWKLRTREHDVLTMVFTRIDPANPAREFSFNLRVCLDNSYAVENITPPLSGWEGDLALLNQSNNLARFIQGMRRRFQETC